MKLVQQLQTTVWLIPRWAGEAKGDFYPWLTRQMAEKAPHVRIVILEPPLNPPIVADSVAWLNEHLASKVRENDIIMTHSVGLQMALRWLAAQKQPYGPVRLFSVAGWREVDKPWDSLIPWLAQDYDVAAARKSLSSFRLLVSDNDRFTSNFQKTCADFESSLGASSRVVQGANHFNRAEEPEVLQELLALTAGK